MRFTRRKFLGCSVAGLTYSAIPQTLFIPGKKVTGPKIAFLTDLHASEDKVVEESYERIFQAVKNESLDLIVGGGDWITNGNELAPKTAKDRFQSFKKLWDTFNAPKLLIPGNHDFVRNSLSELPSLEIFRSQLGSENTSLSFQGLSILTVQSLTFSGKKERIYRGEVDNGQLKWLKAELNKISNETPIVLVTHLPLVTLLYQMTETATAKAPEDMVVTNSRQVLELFKDHNLALVLQGHLHVSEFMKWRGTTFITGGALCGKWWQGEHHGTPPGFGVVTFENGGINWRYRTY